MAKRPPQPLERDKLLNVALRALGGRAHSSGELREKLRRRAQSDEDVDAVLAKLKESGYLNDQRFAENYATARLEDQGLGKMRVLRDLLRGNR
jgi:regulatory protein